MQACAHRAAVGAYAHPDVPFDQVVDALQLERSAFYNPLFQTLFVLQNVPKEELLLPGVAAAAMELERTTAGATFDLTLSLKQTRGGELSGALEFNAALFDRFTIERLAADFRNLLASIVQHPDEPVAGQISTTGLPDRSRTTVYR